MFKMKQFEHEHEVRALISTSPHVKKLDSEQYTPEEVKNKAAGCPIEVSLKDMLERVYVAPRAQDWFLKVVEAETRKHGLTLEVKRSSLDEAPP